MAAVHYRPRTTILALGSEFYDEVNAAQFPETVLRFRHQEAAASVGLGRLSDPEWVEHFGKFAPLPDNLQIPLAQRYHGHQFGHYNPDLGDGRGFLFAQVLDGQNRLLDLGTKGSGQTPYSRAGDGCLTLLGGVREVLATAYLQALNVPTSRSMSLIETGEELQRSDEPSPTRSSVLVRLSHSHIRFGTFQRLAFDQNTDGLDALTRYCLTHYYPGISDETVTQFFAHVCAASAKTVATWMAAGFVHGVMNTDNMNITGESFDYGPYRFAPTFKPELTAAYFDHQNLYAFGRQPQSMYWNLGQLASCLSLISDDKALLDILQNFGSHYQTALRDAVFLRLGIEPSRKPKADIDFVVQTLQFLQTTQAGLAQFYHDFRGGDGRLNAAYAGPNKDAYTHPDFSDWLKSFGRYTPCARPPQSGQAVSLVHTEIEKLWEPIARHDDWTAFHNKLDQLKSAV